MHALMCRRTYPLQALPMIVNLLRTSAQLWHIQRTLGYRSRLIDALGRRNNFFQRVCPHHRRKLSSGAEAHALRHKWSSKDVSGQDGPLGRDRGG